MVFAAVQYLRLFQRYFLVTALLISLGLLTFSHTTFICFVHFIVYASCELRHLLFIFFHITSEVYSFNSTNILKNQAGTSFMFLKFSMRVTCFLINVVI